MFRLVRALCVRSRCTVVRMDLGDHMLLQATERQPVSIVRASSPR